MESPRRAGRVSTAAYRIPAMSWRAFASFWSWVEAPLPASTSPRRSTWAGGWWPSRSRGPMGTSPRSWRGSSTRTSCRCTRSATIRRAGCAVLCMPYFGGANLAQVLEAAGGRVAVGHDGRSLVEALDHISRSLPSCSSRAAKPGSSRRPRPSLPGQDAVTQPAGRLDVETAFRGSTGSRFRSLFSRWVGPRVPLTPALRGCTIRPSLHASSCTGQVPSRPRSGSWPAWPMDSSMPTRAACCTAT